MNVSRILLVFTITFVALAGNTDAGRGSDTLNKIGGIVVSLLSALSENS